MKLEILGLPIFSILNVASKNIRGYKLTLLGLFHLSVTFGDHKETIYILVLVSINVNCLEE